MFHPSAGGQRSVFVNVIILLKTSWCDQTGCQWGVPHVRSVSGDRHVMLMAELEFDTNTVQSVRLRSPVSYSSPRSVVRSQWCKNRSTVLTIPLLWMCTDERYLFVRRDAVLAVAKFGGLVVKLLFCVAGLFRGLVCIFFLTICKFWDNTVNDVWRWV